MDLVGIVNRLVKKYKTRDPYELARCMGIYLFKENLGKMSGYYFKAFKIKQIHINENLPDHLQLFTCAHELGHSILHPNANTPFLYTNTYLSVEKMEIEANRFAMLLLLSDEQLQDGYTIDQLSQMYGYHNKLIELRINESYLNKR